MSGHGTGGTTIAGTAIGAYSDLTFTSPDTGLVTIRLDNGTVIGTNFYFEYPWLVKGGIPADWTPAIEDMATNDSLENLKTLYITDTSWVPTSIGMNIGESRSIVTNAAVTSIITGGKYSVISKGTVYRLTDVVYDLVASTGAGSTATLYTVIKNIDG